MSITNTSIVAVVPAAGIGSRMQADRPKQYLTIGAQTILEHTLLTLAAHPAISRVVVAISPDDEYFKQLPLQDAPWLTTVHGGESRADSVYNALAELADDEWALVHDAARPCVSHLDISRLTERTGAVDFSGGILATPVRDTMKRGTAITNSTPVVVKTEERDNLWHALTPQLFPAGILRDALAGALQAGAVVTDEASAMEFAGHSVELIDSDPANIKITRPADLTLAQFYLQQSRQLTLMRIGHGYDVHKFGGEGPITIGGVSIDYEQGLLAHSDGDVLIHALSDALLGAAALGDIGKHFPDTDSAYAGADSRGLLRDVMARLHGLGYKLVNADMTIVAQAPKMAPYIPTMQQLLASDCQVDTDQINVKATTTEKLGFAGRKEGISAYAVALITK